MCLKEEFGLFFRISMASTVTQSQPISSITHVVGFFDALLRKGTSLLMINNQFYSDHQTVRQMWGNCLELINI